MKFDPQKHRRRSIRLKGYDYSQAGAYFVTIVAWQGECLFGEIAGEEMRLNHYGEIVQKWWHEIPNHFPNVELGAFVTMPNHIHGIIIIRDGRRGTVSVPHNEPNLNNNLSPRNDTPAVEQKESMNQGGAQTRGEMTSQQGGETPPLRMPMLGQIVAYFKYQSTKEMNATDRTGTITKFWQRNYYEHIIRNDHEMENIWKYIESNPSAWDEGDENASRISR
jgi:putative transposase